MGNIRAYINKKFIESNLSLVEAMIYMNRTRGRYNNIMARACRVTRLYIKYVIFKHNFIEERQAEMNKALHPESLANQKRV